ncbi:MAG: S9 family peptidase [Planctomycetes bacterium]|nr:S9 family peptidase [Planctomycetota bacterium]
MKRPCPVIAFLVLVSSGYAQEGRLTLESLHDGTFAAEGAGRIRWKEDGSGYTTLEPGARGGRDIISHDPRTGRRTVLVPAAELIPPGRDRPLHVADYAWSGSGDRLLVFTDTRRVWRHHTRGDYWVVHLKTGKMQRLGVGLERHRLQFAKFSPDASRVAFVHKSDLYVEHLDDGRIVRLTEGGSDTLINGTFDWVYEEEWGLRDGFRWSPDGKSIAFWQIDSSGVKEFVLIDNTSDLYPRLKRYQYPKVGEKNPSARVGVISADGGEALWMKVGDDTRNNYIARMEWAANSREVILQHVNRLQNTIRVVLADASTGETREVFRDTDSTWVEVCDDVHWLDDGKRFTWVSERDGWRHVYVVSRDGKQVACVTPGNYDIVSVLRVDDVDGWIYAIASPDDATQRFLYRVPLAGGEPQRLTPKGGGVHRYQISHDARWAVHTWSELGEPPRVEVVALPEHGATRSLVDNKRLRERLARVDRGAAELFQVEMGGVTVDGWMIKPPRFDPKKKWPLLVYVYGEPAGQTVQDQWGGYWMWHLMLAQRGYVIMSLDNRGTPAPRGRTWRKAVYGQIGTLASQDQAGAVRAAQERWNWIDKNRVGVWGWSGGGSMTLNALFRYPGLYHVGMAIAFIANQRYYDTIYQERYMGLPSTNPDGFRDGSPITHAKNLEGDLLLVYGTGDDNCHYQNCEALVNELVKHNKPFSMLSYPNRTHSISEGPGTRKHLFMSLTDFLTRRLPAGPR